MSFLIKICGVTRPEDAAFAAAKGARAIGLNFWRGSKRFVEDAQAHEMTGGRYAAFFWTGMLLVAAGMLAPWVGAPAVAAAALGLLAYEHAYVQAAQSVPLA